jgi:hypothetical protein
MLIIFHLWNIIVSDFGLCTERNTGGERFGRRPAGDKFQAAKPEFVNLLGFKIQALQ